MDLIKKSILINHIDVPDIQGLSSYASEVIKRIKSLKESDLLANKTSCHCFTSNMLGYGINDFYELMENDFKNYLKENPEIADGVLWKLTNTENKGSILCHSGIVFPDGKILHRLFCKTPILSEKDDIDNYYASRKSYIEDIVNKRMKLETFYFDSEAVHNTFKS